MRRIRHKHEAPESQSRLCVYCLIGVMVSALALGGLRLYGIYLEHQLADVTQRLQATNDRNAALEERYSALLSPARIYTYARTELNMVMAKETRMIRIEGSEQPMVAGNRVKGEVLVARHRSLYDRYISPLLVQKANAKD